ncbi:MAG: hypothetical protein ACRERD_03270, partial [Candidatus Binatia bacterium]
LIYQASGLGLTRLTMPTPNAAPRQALGEVGRPNGDPLFLIVEGGEPPLQGMPNRMTLDEVVALTNAFTNSLDIHSRYCGAFSLYFLRLAPGRLAPGGGNAPSGKHNRATSPPVRWTGGLGTRLALVHRL